MKRPSTGRYARKLASVAAGLLLGVAVSGAEPDATVQASGGPLYDTIAQLDAELFRAVFDTCDVEKVKTLVDDDLEFYHDKGGIVATSGAQFVAVIAKNCADRESSPWRSRRELVAGSLRVYPMKDYGAVETGSHRFFESKDGHEQPASTAQFTHLWRLRDGTWRLARVLSYDHRMPTPPER